MGMDRMDQQDWDEWLGLNKGQSAPAVAQQVNPVQDLGPAGPAATGFAGSNAGAMMPTGTEFGGRPASASATPSGFAGGNAGAMMPEGFQNPNDWLKAPEKPTAGVKDIQDFMMKMGGYGNSGAPLRRLGTDESGMGVYDPGESVPQKQARLMSTYMAMDENAGKDADRNLKKYLGVGELADKSRLSGVAERGVGVQEANSKLAASAQKWAQDPTRILEERQGKALEIGLKKLGDGGSIDPKTQGAINDLVKGSIVDRPVAPGQNTTGQGDGTPPGTMKPRSVDPMADLLQDPQLVHEIGVKKPGSTIDQFSSRDKLAMIHARKGSAWIQQNWPAVQAALTASDPEAVTNINSSSRANAFTRTINSIPDAISSLFQSAPSSTTFNNVNNMPIGERFTRDFGEPSKANELSELIRYLNGQTGGIVPPGAKKK